jgi:hypothetical protein
MGHDLLCCNFNWIDWNTDSIPVVLWFGENVD